MGDFLTNLWESVFTPGTTPTLLIATNLTFGALQLVLALLLFATYSIHFAILSVLSGGLWYSINWFAHELQEAQAKEVEAERLRRKRRGEGSRKTGKELEDSTDDEGEHTEVEGGMKNSTASLAKGASSRTGPLKPRREDTITATGTGQTTGDASGVQPAADSGDSRRRVAEDVDRSGEISTDSEWEKVDDVQ